MFVNFVMSLLLRFPVFKNLRNDGPLRFSRSSLVASLRKNLAAALDKGADPLIRWSKLLGNGGLLKLDVEIPRNDALLNEWGCTNEQAASVILPDKSTVTVHIAFPSSVLGGNISSESTEDATVKLGMLAKARADIPIVLFLHGGGLTIGKPNMSEVSTMLIDVMEAWRDDEPKPFIYGSIGYSLAPEFPFPVAVMETTSVLNWFVDQGFSNIHVTGVSAGGNLALASCLHGITSSRRGIRSIVALCPMLGPSCDTVSFYENAASSLVCPVDWLRWSFRSYLELPEPEDDDAEVDDDDIPDLDQSVARGSNRYVWEGSKWHRSPLRRLVDPCIDLPEAFDDADPLFLLTTNSGDPLLDGGVAMANELEGRGAKVKHFRHKGSHFIGTVLDPVAHQEVKDAVWAAVFSV